MPGTRYVTEEPARNPEERFRLYRLCDCPTCEGTGQAKKLRQARQRPTFRCRTCRGEGRIRQEIASCETPEAIGVAIVTLAREGEWEGCPLGLLDQMPECEACGGHGFHMYAGEPDACHTCKGSGVKPTGTWLILPWLPSARNVSDAGRTLARSKRK